MTTEPGPPAAPTPAPVGADRGEVEATISITVRGQTIALTTRTVGGDELIERIAGGEAGTQVLWRTAADAFTDAARDIHAYCTAAGLDPVPTGQQVRGWPDRSMLEAAWGIIANADWDAPGNSPGWAEAAAAWRDAYHRHLDRWMSARTGLPFAWRWSEDGQPNSLDDHIFQALAAASMSWSDVEAAGIFNDTRVAEIGAALRDAILELQAANSRP